MKKVVLSATVILTAALFSFTAIDKINWSADTNHSRLGFFVNHMGIADVNGSFNTYETKISTSTPDFSDAVVELSADVNSIYTGNEMRDKHLKGPDFFDAEKFPKFTFKSKTFKKIKDKTYTATGDLTMHGVTKTVSLNAVYSGPVTNPMSKKEMCGFKVTGVIKRSDFGVGASFPAPMLGDNVNLVADLEFGKE